MTFLVLLIIFAAMAGAVVFWAFGLRHRWAAWPLVVGWGLAFIAALFMSLVRLCDNAAGTCTEPERMDLYAGALPALIILVVAALALAVKHAVARQVVFPALTLLGIVLVALRLFDDEQRLIGILLLACAVAGVALEARDRTRVRAGARTSAG